MASKKIKIEIGSTDYIPKYLSDEQAERIGQQIAQDFELKRDRDYPDRFITMNGTFTCKGIARRAHRMIVEGLTE